MNANELMIGDWVNVTNTNVKIAALSKGYGKYELNGCELLMSSDNITFANSIPLTEEILKANGFKNNGMDNEFILDGSFRIMQSHLGYFFSLVCEKNVHFNYVHEFQHTLRLCGLNELADNFKIE